MGKSDIYLKSHGNMGKKKSFATIHLIPAHFAAYHFMPISLFVGKPSRSQVFKIKLESMCCFSVKCSAHLRHDLRTLVFR